ncbi:MAG TPA: DUF2946 family protein [Rhizomicrobium sp.]|nr:DUF2946 family protein [Rhizomicrobium sp.]
MMARLHPSKSCPENGPQYRLVVTFVAAIALLFQSYVTQTHIHVSGNAKRAAAPVGAVGDLERNKGGQPSKGDPAHCPLCQAIAYSAHFVAPLPIVALLPTQMTWMARISQTLRVPIAFSSHNWRQRAPPAVHP